MEVHIIHLFLFFCFPLLGFVIVLAEHKWFTCW